MTTMNQTAVDSAPVIRPAVPFFTALTALIASRTWREFGFLWLMLLLAPFAFAYGIFTVTFSAGVAVTVVGLFLAGGVLLGARSWGAMYRNLTQRLLGISIDAPAPFVRPRGFWRSLGAPFADGDAWRALLFMVVTFPLSILATVASTVVVAVGAGAVTYPLWYRFLPAQQDSDGIWHNAAQIAPNYFIDTPLRIVIQMFAGVLLLLIWPWVMRAFIVIFTALATSLLGPTRSGQRIAALRATRAAAVDTADARLRRIERDLHDGTQARLVAVAMQLGEARELLATQEPAQAGELVDAAHTSTKEALTELREIARGIHPPALDAGLAIALETLAARSTLPVTIDVDKAIERDKPLAPAVQSIVYYSVAELLTNIIKHAQATGAYVMVKPAGPGKLQLKVRDDGRGGAVIVSSDGSGTRTGLAGLVERVSSVDGTLNLTSPAGGPTIVTVTLPTTIRP